MNSNQYLFIIILLSAAIFITPLTVFASDCKDSCKQSTSCNEYIACQVAETECITACVQAEAFEKLAESSERTSAAQIKALEQFTETLQRVTASFSKFVEQLQQTKEGY